MGVKENKCIQVKGSTRKTHLKGIYTVKAEGKKNDKL